MSNDTKKLFKKVAKDNNVKYEIAHKLTITKEYIKLPTVYIPNNELKLK